MRIKLPEECPDCGAPQKEIEWHQYEGWLNCTQCEWTGFDHDFKVDESHRTQDSTFALLLLTPTVLRYALTDLKGRICQRWCGER